MTDTPKKTLSLKRSGSAPKSGMDRTVSRSGKRIIKRDDLPRAKAAKPFTKPTRAKKKRPQRVNKPKPEFSPSELRAKALNERLNTFPVWSEFRPLAIGVDKEIFRLVNDECFPGGSKKVVQKVLRMHTGHGRYLQALAQSEERFGLDGGLKGMVSEDQQVIAQNCLQKLLNRSLP